MQRFISALFIYFFVIMSVHMPVYATSNGLNDHQIINVLSDNGDSFEKRSHEIARRLDEIFNHLPKPISEEANLTAPYSAGKLEQAYLQNALQALNLGRFTSGLPPVTLNDEYNDLAQHAVVLLHAANELSHTPKKPSDMDDDFYNKAYKGTTNSNIGTNSQVINMASAILDQMLPDTNNASGYNNVGHRLNALNPTLGAIGLGQLFGSTSTYYAIYISDNSAAPLEYEAIGYPSGPAFNSDSFSPLDNWSITLNPKYYLKPDINDITVTVKGGGKERILTKADNKEDMLIGSTRVWGEYLGIEGDNNIIFRPLTSELNNVLKYYGTYTITVNGIKTLDGQNASLKYSTTFFEWDRSTNTIKPVIESNTEPKNKTDNFRLSISFTIGSNVYMVNEEKKNSEAAPYIAEDGRTMVPIRFIAEALGADVAWIAESQTSTVKLGDKTINIIVGKALPDSMGTAALVNDRLFVPVRYVSEQLGVNVDWNAENKTVHITA